MLKCAGRFCFYGYMATRIPFIKTYSTPQELVQLLKTRGMEITDEEKAQHYLSHIGYYRLSAYMYPLLSIPKEQHLFKQGVTFSKVMMLYRTETHRNDYFCNAIRLKSQKSERISPFWVGGYPPFSADKMMLATSNSDGKATKEKGAKPMKIAYFFCSLKRNRQIFISRNLIPKNF